MTTTTDTKGTTMRAITYKATFDHHHYGATTWQVTVHARDITSGARKALAEFVKQAPAGSEFHSIEFWMAN